MQILYMTINLFIEDNVLLTSITTVPTIMYMHIRCAAMHWVEKDFEFGVQVLLEFMIFSCLEDSFNST